jgi:hypothetical protein
MNSIAKRTGIVSILQKSASKLMNKQNNLEAANRLI